MYIYCLNTPWRHYMTAEHTGNHYQSNFEPSAVSLSVLRNGNVISSEESPGTMIERVIDDLVAPEAEFGTSSQEIKQLAQDIGSLFDNKVIVFSTPILTNAGKDHQRPLSACTVPPVDLRGDLQKVKNVVDTYHQEAMGTGFNLDEVDDPVATLQYLNDVAVQGANSDKEDRPVGNMAICKIDHPKILEFIEVKRKNLDQVWKFNLSVDTPSEFWDAVRNDEQWILRDGKTINARELSQKIAEAAHACADPGIISMDRVNRDNPTPGVGLYTATAPCAEVGLMPGETCQFGYINLAKFINDTTREIDYELLTRTTHLMVRALDNALEQSIARYSIAESKKVMRAKRKIGVGVCGLADMLIVGSIPYDSDQARMLARDVIAHINFQSKLASFELAGQRGSFEAMHLSGFGCRYNAEPGFLEDKYLGTNTNTVTDGDWNTLAKDIRNERQLRNCSTIALPPTGRSGLIIDASTGVEPLFVLRNGIINPFVYMQLLKNGLVSEFNLQSILATGSVRGLGFPKRINQVLVTATELSVEGHMDMVTAIQPMVDESISKTINVPGNTTVEQIEKLYLKADEAGLKGITIYRDGSKSHQPKAVVSS